MALSTTTTSYGRDAYEAMRELVGIAKRRDPLQPVTLLVPSELVGVTARRFLACGLTEDRPGIAALTILTLRRLGEMRAGRDFAEQGRRPLTEPILAATIRTILTDAPGLFEPVRDHTGTVRAIAGAHRELRDLDASQLTSLQGHSTLTDDVLRLHGLITARTERDRFDPVHLTQAATRGLKEQPWERASRDAGVVADRDWDRLLTTATDLRTKAGAERSKRDEPPREWLIERHERQAAVAESLHRFVQALRGRLDKLTVAESWADAPAALKDPWVTVWNGDDTARLSPEDRRAAERVASVIDALPSLDTLPSVGPPSLDGVREVIEPQLADDVDRVGTIGRGVHVGPVSDAIGLDVDLVVVVGLAEGLLPGRHSEHPLLPDELRQLTDAALPTLRERLDRQHRHLLAALAGGRRRLLTFPRGDLRRGGERVPSRWVLPTLRQLTGHERLQASDWHPACAGVSTVIEVPSHGAALETGSVQATAQEWRQRALLAKTIGRGRRHATSRPTRLASWSGLAAVHALDGNLAGVPPLPDPRRRAAIPPTALEAWTTCPHHYLLTYLLGVAPVQPPEAGAYRRPGPRDRRARGPGRVHR